MSTQFVKKFQFQASSFNQAVLIQPIQFSIRIDFFYTRLKELYSKQLSLA